MPRRVRLETALNSVDSPVFLIDARRRVAFLSKGCESLTGWTIDEVGNAVCEFLSEAEPESIEELTSALCPPPESFQGQLAEVPRFFVHKETRQIEGRLVHFFPLGNDEESQSEAIYVLGVITPVPEARPRSERSILTEVHAELAAARHEIRQRYSLSSIVARSRPMQRVLSQIDVARSTTACVHIAGPRGSGREHVARVIHYESPRSHKAFVPIQCRLLTAADQRETITRMIHTDWDELSPVEALQPGCLCFFDVEDMPRDIQERLLVFLESDRAAAFLERVRLASTSTVNLEEALDDDRLLERFYYLLTSIPIELPPLRRRSDDLGLLAQHFLERENRGRDKQVSGFSEDVVNELREYAWPGNVEELREVVRECAAACDESTIRLEHLPFRFHAGLEAQHLGPSPKIEPLDEMLSRIERDQLETVLKQTRGNKAQAAKLLGLTRASLYRRLQNHGLGDE